MLFSQNKNKIKGFTLIELLIVIVIIGILAVALIPKLQGMQDKARYIRVQKDFQNFRTIVLLAQSNTNKNLAQILDDFDLISTDCYVGSNVISDWRALPDNHMCRIALKNGLQKIEQAAGVDSGSLNFMQKDPWGSPYGIDPNEGETALSANPCNDLDIVYTGGPDGNIFTSHPGLESPIRIKPQGCPGGY